MKKFSMIAFMALICAGAQIIFPCTIFNASKNGIVLAGNNEDGTSTHGKVWFVPASEGKYGVAWVGFDKKLGKMGAMNDQGLFFDGNALKFSRMNPQPEKLGFGKNLTSWETIMQAWEMIMQECANVEEVIEMLSKYNLEGWDDFQLMFADKSGQSVVVGADKNGELAITRKKGNYQVSTNFNLANPEFGAFSFPCRRFDIATEMLENMKELTVDYCRSILAAVHSEGASVTLYSNICDLTNGDIYVYNFHNFEEVAKFNLEEELKKGEHLYEISALFPRKTNAQVSFEESQKRTLGSILGQTLEKEGIKSAVKKFYEVKDTYSLIPGQLYLLARGLGLVGRIEEAIEICKISTKEYPKSPETHKQLGDLYLKKNDKKRAIKSYKKSLKLNPKYKEVIEILDRIQNK